MAVEKRLGLLAPLQDLPGTRLVVIGDGPRALPRALVLGSRGVVVHCGTDETFCQAVQASLASGVPVVAPATGGPVDLVEHGRNGWLWPTEQPALLPVAVAALVADDDRRRSMARAARVSVAHRSWEVIGDQLLDVYGDVVRPAIASPGRTRPRAA